jgi:CheY-like chemotaxis protein
MPNMDGIAAADLLRASGCTIPIIAVTAERGELERRQCMMVGMVRLWQLHNFVKR